MLPLRANAYRQGTRSGASLAAGRRLRRLPAAGPFAIKIQVQTYLIERLKWVTEEGDLNGRSWVDACLNWTTWRAKDRSYAIRRKMGLLRRTRQRARYPIPKGRKIE